MRRIKITRNNGTHAQAELPALEAEAWIAQGIAQNWWGQPGEYEIVVEDITAELAAQKAKEDARFAKLQAMKPLAGKSLTATEMKQAIEFLMSELFDERSSLGAELVKYAAESKK